MRKPPRRRLSIADAITRSFRSDASAVARPVERDAEPVAQGRFDRLTGSARHNFNDEMNDMLRSASTRWHEEGDPYWNGGRPIGAHENTPGATLTTDPKRLARLRGMTPYHLLRP